MAGENFWFPFFFILGGGGPGYIFAFRLYLIKSTPVLLSGSYTIDKYQR